MNDFSKHVEPLLRRLINDPDREPIERPTRSTTLPIDSVVEGVLHPLHPNEAGSISGVGDQPKATEADTTAARDAYPIIGIDVLAFYKSFRFKQLAPFPGNWGIFLIDAGIAAITEEMKSLAPTTPECELQELAKDLLVAHEQYHFWIDTWALGQETIFLTKPWLKQYEPYLIQKAQVELTLDDHEESLANYYAYNKLKRRIFSNGSQVSPLLRHVLKLSPPPYCHFIYEMDERIEREGLLAMTVANGISPVLASAFSKLLNKNPTTSSFTITPVNRRHPITSFENCPVFYIQSTNFGRFIQPFQGPDRFEFRQFITKYLSGEPANHTDHEYFRIDNREKIKMPNPHDKTIRGYELSGTLKKAGMTHKEYLQERNQTKNWTKDCPRKAPKPPIRG
jgi:hypothetical protein